MSKFQFKGDWETTINLGVISNHLSNPKFSFRREDLDENSYQLFVYHQMNSNPDPEEEQLNTIEFLQAEVNQRTILSNLYKYIKNVAYPNYKTYISEEEYPNSFPALNEERDLRAVIGLDHLYIRRFSKESYAYYNLMFETCIDEEHGLGFVMHKSEVIEHGSIGGIGYDKTGEHMGMTPSEFSDFINVIRTHPKVNYQKAHPKYNTLKPWQKEFNDNYNYYLWSNGTSKELIDFIESERIPIDTSFKQIRPHMIRENRTELIEYFKSKGFK